MRLTERDKQILETIHACDGLMSLRQIDRLFFSGHGRSQPRARMHKLIANGYIARPTPEQQHRAPLGETVYWLGSKGAAVVAGLQGMTLRDFRWRQQPRLSQIDHNLAVTDFRLDVLQAVAAQPELSLVSWVSEGEFLSQPDTVTYQSLNGRPRKRQVRPDGFFAIRHTNHPHPFAFLLEVDMGTEDNPRFAREKVRPGAAYLKSDLYKARFGYHYGRYLVITTGPRRMQNMKAQAERTGGAGLFYFTTFAALTPETIFNQSVWWLAGKTEPQHIIPPAH